MKLEFSDLSYDSKWHDFKDGARLKIRPYPASKTNLRVNADGMQLSGEEQFDVFSYCLEEVENLEITVNGKPHSFDEKLKRLIFDFRIGGIPEFVMEKGRQFEAVKEEQEKNS